MAEKQQQSAYPSNGYTRSGDTEAAAAHDATEQRKQKRNKRILYIILFVIFQIGIITLFSLTVMKVKTPKFRVRGATFANFEAGTASLQASMIPQFSVKNTNFGRYKYQDTAVEFFYEGAKIGEAFVPKSKAGLRSTKSFILPAVDLRISGSPQLSSHLSGGVVPITSSAKMSGKVELMFIMKKKKSTNMNCSMDIVTATQTITNIVCK